MTKTTATLKTNAIRLDVRQTAAGLHRRIEETLPAVESCAASVDDLNRLIEQRDSARREPDSRAERERLDREIEDRLGPFNEVDQRIREIGEALRDLLAQLLEQPEDVGASRSRLNGMAILQAIDCSLPVSKALALRELPLIRDLLNEIPGRPDRPTPAEVVKKRRRELGLSIEALAEKAGVNKKQIYAITKGDNVTAETLRCVAGALCCEPGDLIEPAKSRS